MTDYDFSQIAHEVIDVYEAIEMLEKRMKAMKEDCELQIRALNIIRDRFVKVENSLGEMEDPS